MKHIQFDTPDYDKIFRDAWDVWMDISGSQGNFTAHVEKNIRDLCRSISTTPWGVTRWSCEGHPELVSTVKANYKDAEGYIRVVPRNREGAMRLIETFGQVCTDLAEEFGWDSTPEVNTNCATLAGDITYIVVDFRSPEFINRRQRNIWWKFATQSFIKHTKEII